MTRRDFAAIGMTTAFALGPQAASAADPAELRSELLFDVVLTAMAPNEVSPERTVVGVANGTFEGPKLKGTVIGPSGDWIVTRRDGSRLLDARMLLQTDDGQHVYMSLRGIAYTPPGGSLHARIVPMFETGATKYAWLNNVVAVGVYRPTPGKIAYRVYEIL
ncbi:MAG TPA: DUF3237 domain-containing protein [Bryobacteraceae bacterium]|nr:DUF3237 domain-containing protein [Bryobacteraceae bacterium]